MKLTPRALFSLLALTTLAPLTPAQEAEVSIALQHFLSKGHTIVISFPEPMVADSEVGKPVPTAMQPTITPALPVEAVWDSTSSMALSLREEADARTIYSLGLPAGLRSLGGRAMPGAHKKVSRATTVDLNYSYTRNWDDKASPIFLGAHEPEDDALTAAAAGKAYYIISDTTRRREIARVPARLRPATVADALAHWESYRCMAALEDDAADLAAFKALPGDTPLPHVWYAEPCPLDGPHEQAELILPELGSFNERDATINDLDLTTISLSNSFSMELHASVEGAGRYLVELEPSAPLNSADAAALFPSLNWYICGVDEEGIGDNLLLGRLQKQGDAWVPSAEFIRRYPELSGFRLRPDGEASNASVVTRQRRTLPAFSGLTRLVLHAEGANRRVTLRCVPYLNSAYGHGPSERWSGKKKSGWITATLTSPQPEIACTVMLSGLREGGRRQVLYRSLYVDSIRARVYRADNAGALPARMLRAYTEQYSPWRLRTERDWDMRDALSKLPPTLFQPGELPLEVAETELPVNEERGSFDPAALFPGRPAPGVYLVELEGHARAEEWKKGRVVSQGLVQVTDLGLMWKSSAGALFAYAYHLSDASPLAEGTLHVLDREGAELATLPVAQGIARGTLPEKAAFLQLRSGEDAYTTALAAHTDRLYNEYGPDYYMRQLGLDPTGFPRTSVLLFTDRRIYRPGETVHLRGLVRSIVGDELRVPEIEEMRLTLTRGDSRSEHVVPMEADGSFTLSLKLEEGEGLGNDAYITTSIRFRGEDEGKAADQAYLSANGVSLKNDDARHLLAENRREGFLSFLVADFSRNEFEVEGELQPESDGVRMSTMATAFTGVPVSHGEVSWALQQRGITIHPKDYPDFCFGDYRHLDPYFADEVDYNGEYHTQYRRGELNARGAGEIFFSLPPQDFPSRSQVSVSASVTNGNGQTLRCTRNTTVESSAVYAGLRVAGRLTPSGRSIPLEALLIQSDESAYEGSPLPCTVTVTRRTFRSYRYGAASLSAVNNVPEESVVFNGSLAVGGKATRLDIPTAGPGIYDIVLRGTDANGKPFASALHHYVWGGSDESPWMYMDGNELVLTADKSSYKPGETARILVQTPVDAELLVTMERGGVHRQLRRSVTVENPVMEIPLEAEDGPVCYISAFLVQKEQGRAENGLPLVKHGTTRIRVDVPEAHLQVELDTPKEKPLIRQSWTVGGRVTGADGKPVAGAGVAFYAVDEGTLQVTGYKLPDAYAHFYAERPCGVSTFTTESQLVGDKLSARDFGNKGVFIGGGDDCMEADGAEALTVRDNFAPCAFWLGNARTDAEGRFSATYAHPDTMTRYRLMAVADSGERFGSAESSYSVLQPVMLEAATPAAVAVGDRVNLPVTISMLPDALPEELRGHAEWVVRLEATNATVEAPARTIALEGAQPVTLTVPVSFDKRGEVRLTWSVTSPAPELRGTGDALALNLTAEPPTPRLRERFAGTLTPGKPVSPGSWLHEDFPEDAQLQFTVSTSPLVGAGVGADLLFHYPYGCVEQTASKLLPWLFRKELENALDLSYPADPDDATRICAAKQNLMSRLRPDGFFGYWGPDGSASEFSAYTLLVLTYAAGQENADSESDVAPLLALPRRAVLEEMKKNEKASLIGLLALATAEDGLLAEDLDAVLAAHPQRSRAENWLVAAVARRIDHPQADRLLEAAKLKADAEGALAPPEEAARLLESIFRAPEAAATASALRHYVSQGVEEGRFRSTWEAGWLCILIHEYLERQEGTSDHRGTVEGEEVSPGQPLRKTMPLAEARELLARGCTLYVAGLAEGWQTEAQAEAVVDKGFRVERRYEKLLPDGSWQPTATFTEGDVVRVSLRATGREGEKSRYFVLEDRLPATFEVVNPDLPSQSLPPCIEQQHASAWHSPAWVDHIEYGRDAVRFFATSWNSDSPEMEVSYIARVVRSGEASAPGARAELMYRPQVYGLSIPQKVVVEPKK